MMSGFGPKLVARWNDWQLIGAVLLSLLVQLLLLGTAGVRRRTKPRMRSKIYFWALHVGSRYIITYPLGILSRASTDDPNAAIQAFWAALLLFHLGRPDDFTALSLEDNLIWHRQGFELFVQALITAYIFSRYCVDQDFKRLIVPFAFISLAGLLKCIEQVFALKQATMEALVKSVLGTADAGPDYADTMDRVDGMLRSGILPYIKIDSKHLPQPNSARRKTLAGVKITTAGGLSLQCVRHAPVCAPDVPAAKKAESLICRSLGITRDGQDVTEDTLKAFTEKFKQHLPDDVIIAMREFFELDNPAVNAVEDALIGHGGEGVLDPNAGLQDGTEQNAMT